MPMLLGGRFIAGAAGSGLIDVISILINGTADGKHMFILTKSLLDAVSTSKVAVLRSHLSLACMVGVSSGAPLGGLLMDAIGWRW
jgi:MFS family permease